MTGNGELESKIVRFPGGPTQSPNNREPENQNCLADGFPPKNMSTPAALKNLLNPSKQTVDFFRRFAVHFLHFAIMVPYRKTRGCSAAGLNRGARFHRPRIGHNRTKPATKTGSRDYLTLTESI